MSVVGDNISDFRRLCRLNQTELAKKVEKSKATINHWEKGINNPPIPVVGKVAQVFSKILGTPIGVEDLVSERTGKSTTIGLGIGPEFYSQRQEGLFKYSKRDKRKQSSKNLNEQIQEINNKLDHIIYHLGI